MMEIVRPEESKTARYVDYVQAARKNGMRTDIPMPSTVPASASDCHVHVFCPELYPFAPDRTYTPGAALPRDLNDFLECHGLRRVVLVQPSVYGTDNRLLTDALREVGTERARGIAVVDPFAVTDNELDKLDACGVRGVRLNAGVKSVDLTELRAQIAALFNRLARSGWIMQIYAPLPVIVAISDDIARDTVPVVLDHFAGAFKIADRTSENIGTVAALMQTGSAYVKLSASYRIDATAANRDSEIADLARRLIEAKPDRILWGSDWPHTGARQERRHRALSDPEPFQDIDDAKALTSLATWAGDAATLKRILVDNPQRLFRYAVRN